MIRCDKKLVKPVKKKLYKFTEGHKASPEKRGKLNYIPG